MNIPNEILEFLREREGWKTQVYLDSLGKPTAGMGHLLSPSEIAQYPVGTELPESLLLQWQSQDLQKAYIAAQSQSATLHAPELIPVLTSMCFQLGTHWMLKFPKTWNLMVTGQWIEAIAEAGDSAWARETPVRYEDLKAALLQQDTFRQNVAKASEQNPTGTA